jgi:hypothetical protein
MKAERSQSVLWAIPWLFAACRLCTPAQAQYAGGTGAADDPYQIATAADLIALGESPEDYDKHFILTADIDLDPNLPARKIFAKAVIAPDMDPTTRFFQGTPFVAVFDGNGYTISHLTITGKDYLGLFGGIAVGSEIRELRVVNVNITGSGQHIAGLVGENHGKVTSCYSTGTVNGESRVGGLVGDNHASYSGVTNCYSTVAVSGGSIVGGLIGANSGDVIHCYSTGFVGGYGDTLSGLVGISRGRVLGCFWDIQTSGQTISAGATGKTTAEMRTAKTFINAGWDFVGETTNGTEDVWWIDEGKDYPKLWWEAAGDPNSGVTE